MKPILAGIETEYGLHVEGRGAENQVEDSAALVRAYPGKRFFGWDYRHESPRSDLRGFKVRALAFDPEDAHFDEGRSRGPDSETRSDRILANGARLYNDHGHPEYATPECWSLDELVMQDLAGEIAVCQAAQAFQAQTGLETRLYKNNTDFHGASYGTHESYLVPRTHDFEAIYRAAMPILIARTVLCGAGKVVVEGDGGGGFQLSQRADFISEPASVETLYRRSLFNTRDEPHADSSRWIRLHVISGDANMIPSATKRKSGLVKLALYLMGHDECPNWPIPHPVEAFRSVSRDATLKFPIELAKRSWTTAREILESYFSAAERVLGTRPGIEGPPPVTEMQALIAECRSLLEWLEECPERFREKVDWAAKKWLLEQVREEHGWDWSEPSLRSFDLEYHNVDPEEGLYFALEDAGEVERRPDRSQITLRLDRAFEPTRARARSFAVTNFAGQLETASWRSLVFRAGDRLVELDLPPDVAYPEELKDAEGVEGFISSVRNLS
jgi:proteasome accessory factor A